MFNKKEGEEGGIVFLGLKGSSILNSQDEQSKQACYRSKIGGKPVPLPQGNLTAKDLAPQCSICLDPLFLVAQVYAPVTTPRVLYIFGCNRASCKNRPGSWRVVRSQQPPSSLTTSPSLLSSTAAPVVGKEEERATTVFTCNTANNNSSSDATNKREETWGGGGGGGWGGDDEEEEGEVIEDLEALLKARDISLLSGSETAKEKLPSTASSSTPSKPIPSPSPLPPAFTTAPLPCTSMEAGQAGPDPSSKEKSSYCFPAYWIDEEIEELDSGTGKKTKRIKGGGEEEESIRARLKKYFEEEKDRALVEMLQGNSRSSSSSSSSSNGSKKGNGAGGGGGGGGSSLLICKDYDEEAYEKIPPATQALLYFQERISCYPQQVLRHAYGGDPLWSTHQPPKLPPTTPLSSASSSRKLSTSPSSGSSSCPACGAARRFELQLMPALLSELQVDYYAPPPTASSSSTTPLLPPPPPPSSPRPANQQQEDTGRGGMRADEEEEGEEEEEHGMMLGEEGGQGRTGERAEKKGGAETEEGLRERIKRQEAMLLPEGGMDWGVVAVYSCEASCLEGKEELVLIQPPLT